MSKYLATVRLIVEAEDWNEAFDFLDELTKTDPPLEIAAYDAKILASNIDFLMGEKMSKRDLKVAGMGE